MARSLARFSGVEVERLAKARSDKTQMHHDGGGLYLVVDKRGSKDEDAPKPAYWVFRYMIDGKARTMGLGAFPDVKLADARRKAETARSLKANGHDPLEVRDAQRAAKRLERATAMTFRDAAETYIASKRPGWKNPKHADQWTATLETYVFPLIGKAPVSEIDNAAVLRVLQQEVATDKGKERLWEAKPETASRLRGRIEAVLGWAIAGGLRTGDNPARWKGLLEHQLPAISTLERGKVKHHPALPFDQMAEFMPVLRAAEGQGARALEFAILTAVRSGEVRGATWGEIDLQAKVWVIPGERMKGRKGKEREHRVPLSDAALAVLKALPRGEAGDLVFPSSSGRELSDRTLEAVLERMTNKDGSPRWVDAKGSAVVPHGFRSTFRDWAGEKANFPNELIEMALAHTIKDKAEKAYRRGDMLDKRRVLMSAWAGFIAKKAPGSNVHTFEPRKGAT